MTTTNYQPPRWLNPEFGPPEDLRRRLQAARGALAPITEMVEAFEKEHGDAINDCHDWEAANDSPDGVWQLINEATGFSDLHGDLMNAAYVLEGLAEDTLRDMENGN